MAKIEPFDEHLEEYEHWFTVNEWVYQSELQALAKVLPARGRGLEIGIGSGLFAGPLGIREGVDPSAAMRAKARERGIEAVNGVAENLPYADQSFDFALMVTTICFVDNIPLSLAEARRVLKPGGLLVIGFVDKDSRLGRQYQDHKQQSVFYRDAVFVGTLELRRWLREAGFKTREVWQTVYTGLDEVRAVQPAEPGHGKGSFVVISASREDHENHHLL